ncbi:MAG TPA: VOC family protein [Chloroflexota bacterium]
MAEIESIAHSGIEGPDSRSLETFYEQIFGATRVETVSGSYEGNRGGNPHPCGVIGDYLYVMFPDRSDTALPPEDQLRGGIDRDVRHAFMVTRDRFPEFVERLQREEVPFEGPVTHPEKGPLGQSVYFKDTGGNFFEVCWRRDEDVEYAPVPVSQG